MHLADIFPLMEGPLRSKLLDVHGNVRQREVFLVDSVVFNDFEMHMHGDE